MAEELDNKNTSEETANDAPATLDQVDPAAAEAPAENEPAAEAAQDAPAEEAEPQEDESLLEKARHAVEDAVEDVSEGAKRLLDEAVDTAKKAAAGAAHAVAEAAEGVAERITGGAATVDPDAPVAFDSAEALREDRGTIGYTGEIQGKVITLAELEAYENRVDPAEPEDRDEALMELYERSMTSVTEGEIVTGRVASIGEKEVVIDI